ncbi:MAG TPA: hypothetical protein PKA64_04180 [Myxococcota bacterium]|nr:hypothetical protein [Myxococcota bacterium]
MTTTKLLKAEHRRDRETGGWLSLKQYATGAATSFPRSPAGRAALAWWRKKSPTRARLVERAGTEQIESMRRAEARLFDEPAPSFSSGPSSGSSAGGTP